MAINRDKVDASHEVLREKLEILLKTNDHEALKDVAVVLEAKITEKPWFEDRVLILFDGEELKIGHKVRKAFETINEGMKRINYSSAEAISNIDIFSAAWKRISAASGNFVKEITSAVDEATNNGVGTERDVAAIALEKLKEKHALSRDQISFIRRDFGFSGRYNSSLTIGNHILNLENAAKAAAKEFNVFIDEKMKELADRDAKRNARKAEEAAKTRADAEAKEKKERINEALKAKANGEQLTKGQKRLLASSGFLDGNNKPVQNGSTAKANVEPIVMSAGINSTAIKQEVVKPPKQAKDKDEKKPDSLANEENGADKHMAANVVKQEQQMDAEADKKVSVA